MARFLSVILLATAALAAPAPQENGSGNQVFSYETVDDYGAATGYHYLNGEPGVSVDGGFGFTDEEGRNFDLTFVADENGYQPSGDFLPQAPEEPPEIREARANFYSLWESIAAEHKRLMEEAAANGKEDNGDYDNGSDNVQVDSYKDEDPVIDSYEVDLRQGEDIFSRKKRQAILPLVPTSPYYVVPQRPVYPLYPAQVPIVPPVLVAAQQQQVVRRPAVVQQQQQPFRVFPAVPADSNKKKQEQVKKPVHPPVIPDIPEAQESGVVAL